MVSKLCPRQGPLKKETRSQLWEVSFPSYRVKARSGQACSNSARAVNCSQGFGVQHGNPASVLLLYFGLIHIWESNSLLSSIQDGKVG